MNFKDPKVIAVIAVVVILLVAAIAVVVVNNNNNKSSDPTVLDGSWDDIVKDANGQTITMGFYTSDTMVKPFFESMQKYFKDTYNITINAKSYGPAAAATAKKEMDEGKMTDGTFDLIWGNTSAYSAIKADDGSYKYVYSKTNSDGKAWTQLLPNSYYLKSNSQDMIKSQISNYIDNSAVNFSNGQTMLVFNQDFNALNMTIAGTSVKVPYNAVVVYEDGAVTELIKVASTGGATTYTKGSPSVVVGAQTAQQVLTAFADSSAIYTLDSVRTAYNTASSGLGNLTSGEAIRYGLPSDFTNLADWVKIYPKQFGYPDYTYSAASFHTSLLVQAAIYELTWNDASAKTGWKVATDRSANVTAVNNLIASCTDEASYKANFGYVYNYLNDIEPYVHVYATNETYQKSGTITDYNNKIVGNNAEKDFSDATIMIAMSTITCADSRVGEGLQYTYNAGAFTLDTGCSSDYYIYIPANSSHVTAAMVVMNWFLDPEIQYDWYAYTGNGYNIDTSKKMLDANGKETNQTVAEFFDTEKSGAFTNLLRLRTDKPMTNNLLKISSLVCGLGADRLAEVTVVAKLTSLDGIGAKAWASNVRDA